MKFTSPPKREEFNGRVWDLARRIPRGKVASYGQLALMLSPPEGVESSTYRASGPAGWAAPWRRAPMTCPGSV